MNQFYPGQRAAKALCLRRFGTLCANTKEDSMAVKIITDSASDITPDRASMLGVEVIPMTTVFGETEYLDGVTLTNREFFEKLIETDELPHTSQITPFQYEEAFKKALCPGDEAVYIAISSKLSGSCGGAAVAAEAFGGRVTVVDSENVSIGQQLLVLYALRLRDRGLSAGEIARTLKERRGDIRVLALLDTLEYLKKGGRISPTVAFAGGLLSIKPVVSVENGEVVLAGKARGSKNGNNLLMSFVEKSGGIDFDMPYMLAYSGLDDALLQKYIRDSEALYKGRTGELPVCAIGSAIGTHVGPGAVGVAFFSGDSGK